MRTIFKHHSATILEYDGPACNTDEMQATKELLAYEHDIDVNDIHVIYPDTATAKSPLIVVDKSKPY